MKVNLINTKTKKVIETFDNVLTFNQSFITIDNGGYTGYIYAVEEQQFVKVEK